MAKDNELLGISAMARTNTELVIEKRTAPWISHMSGHSSYDSCIPLRHIRRRIVTNKRIVFEIMRTHLWQMQNIVD